jgi:hypothetical protein
MRTMLGLAVLGEGDTGEGERRDGSESDSNLGHHRADSVWRQLTQEWKQSGPATFDAAPRKIT